MIRQWSHTRQKGSGYPPKKTACQSGLRFQSYKPLKSVTTAGRPLILRFLVYISRNSLRASRSLVITTQDRLACLIYQLPLTKQTCHFSTGIMTMICILGCVDNESHFAPITMPISLLRQSKHIDLQQDYDEGLLQIYGLLRRAQIIIKLRVLTPRTWFCLQAGSPLSGSSLPSLVIQLLILSRRRRSTSLWVARRRSSLCSSQRPVERAAPPGSATS